MDRIEAMETFVSVVDSGGFSAAARKLGTPLPTISRRISELEASLKVRLLQRNTRNVSLTDAGVSYLDACRRILVDVAEAERVVVGEYHTPRGELSVSAPIVFGRHHVLPVVAKFLEEFPDIDIRLDLTDRRPDLVSEQIDVAVLVGMLEDSEIVAKLVEKIRLVTCASPQYLAMHGAPKEPADLAKHSCVLLGTNSVRPRWSFGSQMVDIQPRLVVNTDEAAVDAAVAGLGVARVLCYQAAPSVRAGHLELLFPELEPPPWPVNLVYASRSSVPAKLRAFIDFALPLIRASVAAVAI